MTLHPKVVGTAVASAVATLILWAVSATGHSLPPEVAAACITLLGALTGYVVPSPAP